MKVFASDKLKETRIKKGFSAVRFAKEVGITRSGLAKIEGRENGISPENSKKVLEILEVEFDDVFTLVEDLEKV